MYCSIQRYADLTLLFAHTLSPPPAPPYPLPITLHPLHPTSGAFPVLVEIGSNAFKQFPGRIRFASQPFPALKTVGMSAFQGCLASSIVELVDQR